MLLTTLRKKIVEYYLNQNFYVACALGNLVIDGFHKGLLQERILVGFKVVEETDTIFIQKSLSEICLIHCSSVFLDTNRFILDDPNLHMIGHGRWEKEIEKQEFLKLFNAMLYICDEYDY